MRAIVDPQNALAQGLAAIRAEYQVPGEFPQSVLAEAEEAARRAPTAHVDRRDLPFATLDPATSTDLDQAFAIEKAGSDLILHYAIADVGWFVDERSAIDQEAWLRGETLYLPDGKANLYPPVLSEGAASLLPDVDRPAILFAVRVDGEGEARIDGVERAVVRSRAKLAYDGVGEADLPAEFVELARRIAAAEERRGAARVDPPEQEVVALGDGGYDLRFRPREKSEEWNAALSLATNLAVARLLGEHKTGLFRVMPEPNDWAIRRLRHTARAFGLEWPKPISVKDFERGLDPADPRQAAMMAAVRRAGGGATYATYGAKVWHSAVAAPYAHATAPLRRLADRYICAAALALANGEDVPTHVAGAFPRLPKVMNRAESKAAQIDRAVIDLAETVMLQGNVGEQFEAVVTDSDDRGDRIQLCDVPVVARLDAGDVTPGDRVNVRLESVDPVARKQSFVRAA